MEKKGLRKKDMLRMDGLLPPTRRLPVCDAVSGTVSDKKKDKKWSLGGILRRISSIKDCDSSSNDEEIVYCKRTPRKPAKFDRQSDDVVLHSIENNSEHDKRVRIENNNVRHSTGSSPSCVRRDSLHSRGSDGSLDGPCKKIRKNKLKARAEAKRDNLRANSSSDEECRRSNTSLNGRFHGADGAHNGGNQRSNLCNRKTRAARTERYIKRLSRDDVNGSGDALNDLNHKRCSSEYIEDEQLRAIIHADGLNGSCRPPAHPRRPPTSNRALPIQRSSAENLLDADRALLPAFEIESFDDPFRRYSTGQYITDLNQNNTYGKIARNISGDRQCSEDNRQVGNFFTYPAKNDYRYSPSYYDYVIDCRSVGKNNRPPEPPPRDPRYRVFNHGYNSYPTNRNHQNVPSLYKRQDRTNGWSRPDRYFRAYGSNNEMARCDAAERRESESPTISYPRAQFRNSLESVNNKYNSNRYRANDESMVREETDEAMRCRRRNTRNDQLNSSDANYGARKAKNNSANICESNKHEAAPSYASVATSPDWSASRRSPCERIISTRSITPTRDVGKRSRSAKEDAKGEVTLTDETLERRRSSKNLEEALSELEAIYKSLRLGDEDLLDRAERRSMEEFNMKQGKSELDAPTMTVALDSPDRTKDDMAYRRMHPKERPASLSDVAGQSTLSNISYLIASPILARRDTPDDLEARAPSAVQSARRDEPDVTRDDVVFRSISRANNTLKIIDPQPPFGIPLGPVTGAAESDYLHTTPTKSEQPRSPYIPQCEPDVVTDDLAYRALRKDAAAARHVVVVVAAESKILDATREPTVARGAQKKRAVRSMSANLYGLIDHDRIHLSSLDAIGDEAQDVGRELVTAASERPGYFRRVVSDGELSDNDARRRKEPMRNDIDINGNHSAMGVYRKKLSSVHVSPGNATAREGPRETKGESSIAQLSDAVLCSPRTATDDEFWREYLRPDSDASNANSDGRSTAEADFTAYSRLCQDLVNLIKTDDDDAPPSLESAKVDDYPIAAIVPSDKSRDLDVGFEVDKPSTGSHTRSLDSHCPRSQRIATHANGYEIMGDNANSSSSSSSNSPPVALSTNSTTEPESASTPDNGLDFYFRMADENVKLIAAAFGSVADHLRDSRLSARKSSSSTSRSSEVENQSGSTRSSTLCSHDDATTSDDHPLPPIGVSPQLEEACAASKRNSCASNEDRSVKDSHFERKRVVTADVELDLSRAVHDLQRAAASLCEHGREIEELEVGRGRQIVHDVAPAVGATNGNGEDNSTRKRIDSSRRESREEDLRDAAPIITVITDAMKIENADMDEDNSIKSKISLIADALKQEQERDREQEETTIMTTTTTALPSGIAETRGDAREESCEGERKVCDGLDHKSRCCNTADKRRSDGTHVSCVTNLITRVIAVTTYPALLLACLLALLLAIVVASRGARTDP